MNARTVKICPKCGKSDMVVKHGMSGNTACKRRIQRYWCNRCGYKFQKRLFPRWNKQDLDCRPTACDLCGEKGKMWLHETVKEGSVYRFRCGKCGQVMRVEVNGTINNNVSRSSK